MDGTRPAPAYPGRVRMRRPAPGGRRCQAPDAQFLHSADFGLHRVPKFRAARGAAHDTLGRYRHTAIGLGRPGADCAARPEARGSSLASLAPQSRAPASRQPLASRCASRVRPRHRAPARSERHACRPFCAASEGPTRAFRGGSSNESIGRGRFSPRETFVRPTTFSRSSPRRMPSTRPAWHPASDERSRTSRPCPESPSRGSP